MLITYRNAGANQKFAQFSVNQMSNATSFHCHSNKIISFIMYYTIETLEKYSWSSTSSFLKLYDRGHNPIHFQKNGKCRSVIGDLCGRWTKDETFEVTLNKLFYFVSLIFSVTFIINEVLQEIQYI